MARRDALTLPRPGLMGTLGWGVAALVLALVLGTLALVALRTEATSGLAPGDLSALWFTLWQAALSAALSIALALPVARALARRSFPGRGALVSLMGAPFILPVIVAIMGLLAIFGRQGLLNDTLALVGLPRLSIYGWHGVILAHVFFNLPLAVRLLLQGWAAIPAERFRLAASLNARPRDVFRLIEGPMLRATLPGAFMVIFLICTTSFAVALTLGGGPRSTTIELAIYQAFTFDFDLSRAALLALFQVALSGGAALLALRLSVPQALTGGHDRPTARPDAGHWLLRVQDAAALILAAGFLLLPLGAVALQGLPRIATLPTPVWQAAARSLTVALGSTALMLALALPLATAVTRARGGARLIEAAGYLTIATSPLVLGTGFFLALHPIMSPSDAALAVTALVNAIMALPFALRALTPALTAAEEAHGRLATSLGLTGWTRWRWLLLPRARRGIGFAAGLTAALSMGDLGVITLFAPPDGGTLPLHLYGLMGAYRMEDAAGAALLLLLLSLTLFWVFDRGGRLDAHTR